MAEMKIAVSNCSQWKKKQQQHSPAIHRPPSLFSSRGLNLSYKFLSRSRSLHINKLKRDREELKIVGRSFSTTMNGFTNNEEDNDDVEFVKRIQKFVLNFTTDETASLNIRDPPKKETFDSAEPTWPAFRPEPPRWLEQGDRDIDEINIIPASVERKANSIDLPLSLRIIKQKQKKKKKKKKRSEEEEIINSRFLRGAGESACCSVKKAFSSMVFILRELQGYTLQMRQVIFYENLQGILSRVHGEMNASFVWLFQQIFSCTPTLMVYVMLLLANFTVHSIGNNYALAAASPDPTHQSVVIVEHDYQQQQANKITDTWSTKTLSIGRRTASMDGYDGGGGGTTKPVAGATDDGSDYGSASRGVVIPEEEAVAWNRMVEEATRMHAIARDDQLLMDHDTLQSFVSPVRIQVEQEDYEDYLKTEMTYRQALALDPENTLLLSNFAQFLYLVLHDHDRAEYYFKRAIGMKPADAESLNRYASFLWLVRKDMGAAEETYLEAIAVEPSNTYYAANYAHFLWNTGGEDTCYPLDGGDHAC